MMFYGYHGLFSEENKLGQRFTVDVELMGDFRKAGQTDRMEDSIDYGQVYEVTKEIMEGKATTCWNHLQRPLLNRCLTHFLY